MTADTKQLITLLDKLAEAKSELAEILEPYEAKLAELEAQYITPIVSRRNEATAVAQVKVGELDEAVRTIGRSLGCSVKGTSLHLVWSKGKESWDTSSLDEYIESLEDEELRTKLLSFKVRKPSVSIRKVSTVEYDTSTETKELF